MLGRFIAGTIPPVALAQIRWSSAALILLPFAWPPSTDWVGQGDAILSFARDLAGAGRSEASRIDVVWSAGKAGFASSEKDLASEHQVFGKVLEIGRRQWRVVYVPKAGNASPQLHAQPLGRIGDYNGRGLLALGGKLLTAKSAKKVR